MNEPLFEIENWRDAWYYKFGAIYTGPFRVRRDAVEAAEAEVAPLVRTWRTPSRASPAAMPQIRA